MIELKRVNVHKIVETKEKAFKLISDGFEVVKDELNLLGKNIEEKAEEVKEEIKEEIKEVKEKVKK